MTRKKSLKEWLSENRVDLCIVLIVFAVVTGGISIRSYLEPDETANCWGATLPDCHCWIKQCDGTICTDEGEKIFQIQEGE